MYGVFTRKTLFALLVILIVVLILMGVAGNVMGVSAAPRELPIYSVETPEKVLSLGINCAWDDSDIEEILKLLDERGVKATFFVVGTWADHYPDAVRRIAAAGHEVGSHSNTHPDMTKLRREEIAQQLDASGSKLEALTGQKPVLFRAPSGAYNNLVVSTARSLGWEVIQWSNDSLDWKGLSVEEITARVTGAAGPGDIMLFHAGKPNTAEALRRVIDTLAAQGYRFAPVGELVYGPPYTIDHTGRQHK